MHTQGKKKKKKSKPTPGLKKQSRTVLCVFILHVDPRYNPAPEPLRLLSTTAHLSVLSSAMSPGSLKSAAPEREHASPLNTTNQSAHFQELQALGCVVRVSHWLEGAYSLG